MMQFWKRSWLWILIGAIVTTVLGYLTSQLPEFPNKAANARWIIAAVVVLTLVAWWVAMQIQGKSISPKTSDRLASQEMLVGVKAESIKAKNLRQSSKSGQPTDQTMLKDVKAKNIDLGDVHQEH
jgi:type VI protein secretion system component VasK